MTGVSGSGKSSLIEDVLYNSLAGTHRTRADFAAPHDCIRGVEQINKVIRVDQQPLGSTPASNPATYTGVFERFRELFCRLPDAKIRGYRPRRFSFNRPRRTLRRLRRATAKSASKCTSCPTCGSSATTAAAALQPRNAGRALSRTSRSPTCSTCRCGRALELFQNIPKIRRVLETLCDVGLDYLALGQSAPTLSGGEAQRVKLAAELARPNTGQTLYLLDEPTTGLHFDDLASCSKCSTAWSNWATRSS